VRAFASGEPVVLRQPAAVRPGSTCWSRLGYLRCRAPLRPRGFGEVKLRSGRPTRRVRSHGSDQLSRFWGDGARWGPIPAHPHEAGILQVDARRPVPVWVGTASCRSKRALHWTVDW
jgi:hypothetical protein